MEISRLLNQMDPTKIKKIKNTLSNLPQNQDQTGAKSNLLTQSGLVSLLENTSQQNQKLILNTLLNSNLPLTEDRLVQLINLLESDTLTSNLDQKSLLKSLSFLTKEGLPLLGGLIQGVGQNVDSTYSLLPRLINQSQLPENIKNLLSLTISHNNKEIAEKLINYPDILKDVISQLSQKDNNQDSKLINHLLGEFLLNNQKEGPLLALEIPLFWPEQEKATPLFLSIWKNDNPEDNENSQNSDIFEIRLNLELEKRGLIQAQVQIVNNNIKTVFQATSEQTVQLIEEKIPLLEKRLENLDYNLKTIVSHTEMEDLNCELPVSSLKQTNSKQKEYIHVDFLA